MKTAFRVAALFAVYSAIGFGGDYAASLLGQDGAQLHDDVWVAYEAEPDVDVNVVVDVLPEVVVDVQVRHSTECSYAEAFSTVIPVGHAQGLRIDAGSGALVVQGDADVDEVTISAEACASEEAWLDDLRVTIERAPSVIEVMAHYPEDRNRRGGENTARIDMVIHVPPAFPVSIDDSSGDIVVSNVGDLEIDDSSGSIEAFGIRGDVWIDDSSGNVEVEDVTGDLSLEDGSGGIDIRGVEGSIVLRDGSGGIDISEVGQDVLIESDGSGSIQVENVLGDFTVRSDGSGGIRHSNVGGQIDIPEDDRRRRRRRGGR